MRWIAVALLACAGCIQELDQKIQVVDDDFYKALKLGEASLKVGITAHEQTESSRSSLERAKVDDDLKTFWERHTDASGRLVSATTRPDGSVELKPMLREDVERVIRDRDTRLLSAELNHRRNVASIETQRDAVSKIMAAAEVWYDAKTSLTEKKRAMATAANAALQSLITAGTSAGIIVPLAF